MAIVGVDNPKADTATEDIARTTVQVVNGRIGAETIPAMITATAAEVTPVMNVMIAVDPSVMTGAPTGGSVRIIAGNGAMIGANIVTIAGNTAGEGSARGAHPLVAMIAAGIEVSIGDITGAGAALTGIIAVMNAVMNAGSGKHKHPERASIPTGCAILGIVQKNGATRMNRRFLRE